MDVYERSVLVHRQQRGKLETRSRVRLDDPDALSLAYTPGFARPCELIARDPGEAWNLTWKGPPSRWSRTARRSWDSETWVRSRPCP